MPMYKAEIKYMYGSGKASTSTRVSATSLKGQSESAVMAFLREKHKSVKDLQILIQKIDWK